jgi:hypothetical protein
MKENDDNENDKEKNTKENIIENKDKNEENKKIDNSNDDYIAVLIQKILDKFNIENTLQISFKKLISRNYLYFSLRYHKTTSLNPYDKDICFSITLENKEPYKIININCLSNFTFPTLCDNRNLYKAIINIANKERENKINGDEKDDIYNINNKYNENIFYLEYFIDLIPNFIKEIKKNEEIGNFIKLGEGEYNTNRIYEINDFLISQNNKFFRAKQIIEGKELDRYIIITDIYLILIEPLEDFKNKGTLLFFGFLYKLEKEETEIKDIINFNWKKNESQNQITIKLKIEKNKENLLQIIDNKINQLINKYKNIKIK